MCATRRRVTWFRICKLYYELHELYAQRTLFFQENKETEYVRYNFTLTPRTIEFFKDPLEFVFTDPEQSIFLQGPFLFRYFTENENGEMLDEAQLTGDRKFILIRIDAVLIGTSETKSLRSVTRYEDMKEIILKYFPRLSNENVEKSLEFFYKNK